MTIFVAEDRTAPAADGPWSEPVPYALTGDPCPWKTPWKDARGTWHQIRAVEYVRVEPKEPAE